MNYSVAGTEKGTIFCIHGNSSSAKAFQGLLKSDDVLNTKVAIDLKGHGKNLKNNDGLNDFTFDSQKKYILNQLSEINDEILLVGNSFGGHLAIEIAHEIKNLKGLVIMGTPPVKKPINFDEAFIPVDALNTYFTENPSESEIVNAALVAVDNKSNSSFISSDFKKANPLVRRATAEDITQDKLLDEFSLFTDLPVPKYIISGTSDPSINRSYLEYVKDCCGISCKIIDLERCGHFPSIERPNQFNNIIKGIAAEVFRQ